MEKAGIFSSQARRIGSVFTRSLLLFEQPLPAMLLAGVIYLMITSVAGEPWRTSLNPYHNYLADAFLHGQLHLRLMPPDLRDLSLFDGKYFLYWGPFPGVMLMPFVALFGVGISDITQSLIAGALCTGLFALLLREATAHEIISLSPVQRAAMVVFFALGTPITPLPAVGRVWELSSLWTVCFMLLAFLAAMKLHDHSAFFWTGMALAAVAATRINAVLIGIFLAWFLLRRYWSSGTRRLVSFSLAGLAPLVIAGIFLLLYNDLRFGNALDNGLNYQLSDPFFTENKARYGFFDVHYIPANIKYMFLVYPFNFRLGMVEGWGGSLFLLSPLYFAALYALVQDRRKAQTWVLFVTVLIGTIPTLVNIAPGTFQFGPRYTLDYAAPLLLLTCLGMRRWPAPLVGLLIFVSVLHYLVGSLMFAAYLG